MILDDIGSRVKSKVQNILGVNQGAVTSHGEFGWSGNSYLNPLNWPQFRIYNASKQELNPETALEVSVFYACVSKISKDIAKLPIDVKKVETNDEGQTLFISSPKHPLYKLLNHRPSTFDMTTSFTFWETFLGWALRYQGSYAYIERDKTGLPISLDLVHPSRVTLNLDDRGNVEFVIGSGETANGEKPLTVTRIPERDMLYIHSFGNGQNGIPLSVAAKEALGISKAAQQFQASFFGNGLQVSAVLETPLSLDRDVKDKMKEEWRTKYGSNGIDQGSVAILDADLKYKPMSMTSSDSELLETRKFQIAEIARYFDMPLPKLQELDNATLNNVENLNIQYLTDTLMPWIVKIEKEIKMKLLPDQSPFVVEFDSKMLRRGDMKSQGDFARTMLGGGNTPAVMTVNEVRKGFGFNPHEDGDELYAPLNIADVDLSRENTEADIALKKQQLELNESTAEEETDGEVEEVQVQVVDAEDEVVQQNINIDKYLPLLVQEVQRMCNKESKFYEKAKDLDPEEYIEKANKFYSSHLIHMVDNFKCHTQYLNSNVDLDQLCKEACDLEKGDNWQEKQVQYITDAICASAKDYKPMVQYPDGVYKDEDGVLFEVRGGEVKPYEA